MKARFDLEPKDIEVLNNPDNYYIDSQGRVNELEDDAERILFGSVAKPPPLEGLAPVITRTNEWLDHLRLKTEKEFWRQAEHEARLACEPSTNPHLMAVNAIINILENKK